MTNLPPFQTLLERHAEDVWRTLRAMVGAQAAEDCFQETFLAALRAYPRLRADSAPRAWLLTIAHNKAIDHLRRNATVSVADVPEHPANAADPDDGGLWEAVAALPPRQRAVVALRYVGDLRHAEIAAAVGCSPEASRQALREGLATLRRTL